ncbi:arylsulfatase [Draconibacterium sp. IB214405]|uniref:arylsulfatase n=1 Tax=Draconibacterium sp. IB214405 TaxID=3097352 RepID=UPI002A0E60A7|nr:arylsulfatase [Draconibacterium sp. IB214405]MDX8340448.1 arylsulfatase [Draconibacterium sp. IB214405]
MKLVTLLAGILLFSACQQNSNELGKTQAASGEPDRTVLPITPPELPKYTELDARDATPPEPWSLKAPEDAPNVVVVLLDDMGFGQSSAFGGPIRMPAADKLARQGLQYNSFHTTAMCSSTRAALLSGRNHHTNRMGAIADVATSFPGYTGMTPQSCATIAEVLKLNGYNTAQYGKNHETGPWEVSVSGPKTRYPNYKGFEEFYGFMGGETNQFRPALFHNTTKVEMDEEDPDYHLTEDMADKAILYMKSQKALTPDKPFFVYFAPGAVHAPIHVPDRYMDKYKGEFDEGWDVLREKTLARQIEMGIVPEGTKLAEKPDYIKDWDDLTETEKKVYARQMEVFAAFGEHTDDQVGRLYDAIEDMGIAENTIFIYILGDNGASAEGMATGLFNENVYFNAIPESVEFLSENLDKFGTDESYAHYASGWAIAGCTPFKWAKQIAGNFGGTRNGLIIDWPGHIEETGVIREQFCHAIDIVPTILDAVGLPQPVSVNGVEQLPMEGTSLIETFTDPSTPELRTTQYFEIAGNRGIYHDGWMASVVHKAPWELHPRCSLADDVWELFNVEEDFSQSTNLADQYPEKVKEMEALFMEEAEKYNVLPLDDRTIERFNAKEAGRPDLMEGRKTLTVYDGMYRMLDNAFINVKNTSLSFTTEIEIGNNADGVILAQGGRFGGYSLYMMNGKPAYSYNWGGVEHYDIISNKVLSAGKHTLVYEFEYDGGGLGKGGTMTILVDGNKIAEGRIENTISNLYSLDEGADVGFDEGTNVTPNYGEYNNRFSGKINFVKVDIE